ncbi:aldehyde dehydrogenase family protein [Ruegeria sp. WL0004]|uniref:Aldehyde dehydrogenase family protein n=1 Tax=Ruegeria marisflavi TaxID=2984152 RepID=A0ABT2X1G1_9RHOB|nr:aldehyde dehydrogenase family protein [Ruegeria sp. WL0004]MCU9839983.1 aldehyde dehydrogenase family protein [Ruegeria sp. WL0004]
MNETLSARYYLAPDFVCYDAVTQPVSNPATEEAFAERAVMQPRDIEAIVAEVGVAQAGWCRLDAKSRAAYLHRLASRIEETDMTECAVLMSREMGKPYPEAIGEVANCAPIFRYYAEMARDDAGKVAGSTQAGSLQFSRYEPYGVSVHIMPFNFPILLACWTVAASLAAGNGCIIKPAEATTLSTLKFMSVFDVLPKGLVACLPGDAATGALLIECENTHAVAFTGSVAAGRKVAAAAAGRMKPSVIEAGGSDPMIISASAPIEVAAAGAVTGAFHLSGQVCTSTERIYVVDEVHDRFVRAFADATSRLRIGSGLEKSEIGPLVSQAARQKVERLVADAIARGAECVCGGRVPAGRTRGWFFEPTILTGCRPDMDIMKEEVFGPVAAIVRVPDFETAVAMANDSPFGLGASIFTTDLAEAHEAAERLQAGMVWINNPMIDNDALPFGGWKSSGLGRELGRQGLDAFRRSKMVILDHKPVVQDWWYPYPDDWFLETGGRKHV